VRPKPHRHDSLLAQYLVADPHFEGDAPVTEHRHHHPRHPDGGSDASPHP
jgi:hypothetical protein